jgi:undecaprenyl-diphosphatase
LSTDTALFRALNGMAGRSAILDALMIAGARYAVVAYVVLLAVLWLRRRPPEQRIALLGGVSVLVALGIGQLLGLVFPHHRPFDTPGLGGMRLLVTHPPDSGFPSDHATLAFAVTAVLWSYRRRIGILCLAIGLWIAVARVYVGVHFPSDVLGGAILGSAVSTAILWLDRRPPLRNVVDRLFDLLRKLRVAAPASPSGGRRIFSVLFALAVIPLATGSAQLALGRMVAASTHSPLGAVRVTPLDTEARAVDSTLICSAGTPSQIGRRRAFRPREMLSARPNRLAGIRPPRPHRDTPLAI